MKTTILITLLLCFTVTVRSQHILYIGSDRKADQAQRMTTAALDGNIKKVIAMQKQMSLAEEQLCFELREQESFLKKRYLNEQQIDAYFKDSPLVIRIFNERFHNQEKNLISLGKLIAGWKYASLFDKSIENIRNDMDDIRLQWKQATEVGGNDNRMTNTQRNSLMEATMDKLKELSVTTRQLKETIKGLFTRDKETVTTPNATTR